jgi:hypothetical protein
MRTDVTSTVAVRINVSWIYGINCIPGCTVSVGNNLIFMKELQLLKVTVRTTR